MKRGNGISLSSNVLLPSRGAFVASNSLLPAWLLMPSRRQCHTHVDGAPSRLPGRSDRGLSRLFFPRPKLTKSHFQQAASNFSRPARQTDLAHPFNVPYPVSHFNQRSPTFAQANCSNMFRTSNHISPHLTPINTRIQLLIHQPANHHIVSSH